MIKVFFYLQDPKNVQELTTFIQNMLQQMQDRFQSMSDQVLAAELFVAAQVPNLDQN